MKKLLSILAVVLMFQGTSFAAYTQPSDPGLKESSPATAANPVKVYRLVRNPNAGANDTTFASGDVVLWDTISDDGVTVNKTTDLGITTSSDAVAGVVVGQIQSAEAVGYINSALNDLGNRNWGYIQIYGPALAKVSGNVRVGAGLHASPIAGTASDGGSFDGAFGVSSDSLGFALDAVTTGPTNTIEVFVRTR